MNSIIVSSIALISLVISLMQTAPAIRNQKISELEPSQNLVNDSEAMLQLNQIVATYKHRKQSRLEGGSADIFRQEDFELFNEFIKDYNNTDSALTAKLIIATLLSRDAIMPDLEFPKRIYKDIADDYLDRWQGQIAKRSFMVFEFLENDPKMERQEYLIALRNESKKLLDVSKYLDNNTRPDIQAFCSLDNFPWVYITIESLAKISRDLGEYEKAKEYYEQIIELYPDTIMERRAMSSINHLQSDLNDTSKLNNMLANTKPISDSKYGIASARAGEKSNVSTNTDEQPVIEEQRSALLNKDTEFKTQGKSYFCLTLLFSSIIIIMSFILILLGFLRYKIKHKTESVE